MESGVCLPCAVAWEGHSRGLGFSLKLAARDAGVVGPDSVSVVLAKWKVIFFTGFRGRLINFE